LLQAAFHFSHTRHAALIQHQCRDSSVREKFLPFAVILCDRSSGGDGYMSAGLQRVRQGREFDRDLDLLRWKPGG
jgi:hypothetical protein